MTETKLIFGDCTVKMRELPENSIDSCVTDPPYFIGIQGEDWDDAGPSPKDIQSSHVAWIQELYRVLKPGAYVLAFSATRTVHRMVCAFEDCGFQIRDELCWVHPQGISKSMDLAKQIDKLFFEQWLDQSGITSETAKQRRNIVSDYMQGRGLPSEIKEGYGAPPWGIPVAKPDGTVEPAHPEAKKHFGEGTGLRPVWEPIVLARKPAVGTLTDNVLKYGTGGLQIENCRIPTLDSYVINRFTKGAKPFGDAKGEEYESITSSGRFPPNLLVEPGGTMDPEFIHCEGKSSPSRMQNRDNDKKVDTRGSDSLRFKRANIKHQESEVGDGFLGSYTRLFVIPKPSPREKDVGLDEPNLHPSVKPTSLMRHLVKLITPKNGIVIDPFMGSGTTGVSCVEEERGFIGIEMTPPYFEDATKRIEFAKDGHSMSFASVSALLDEEENHV